MAEFLIVILLITISFNFISYFILPFNVRKILDLVEEMNEELKKTRKTLEKIRIENSSREK